MLRKVIPVFGCSCMWKLNRGIDTVSSLSAKCPSRLAAAHPKVWHLLKHVRWRRARRSGSKARERLRRKRRRHPVLAKQRKVLHSFSTIAVFFSVSSSSLSLSQYHSRNVHDEKITSFRWNTVCELFLGWRTHQSSQERISPLGPSRCADLSYLLEANSRLYQNGFLQVFSPQLDKIASYHSIVL